MRLSEQQISDARVFCDQVLLAQMQLVQSSGYEALLALPPRAGRRIYLHAHDRGSFGVGYMRRYRDDLILCVSDGEPFTPERAAQAALQLVNIVERRR